MLTMTFRFANMYLCSIYVGIPFSVNSESKGFSEHFCLRMCLCLKSAMSFPQMEMPGYYIMQVKLKRLFVATACLSKREDYKREIFKRSFSLLTLMSLPSPMTGVCSSISLKDKTIMTRNSIDITAVWKEWGFLLSGEGRWYHRWYLLKKK